MTTEEERRDVVNIISEGLMLVTPDPGYSRQEIAQLIAKELEVSGHLTAADDDDDDDGLADTGPRHSDMMPQRFGPEDIPSGVRIPEDFRLIVLASHRNAADDLLSEALRTGLCTERDVRRGVLVTNTTSSGRIRGLSGPNVVLHSFPLGRPPWVEEVLQLIEMNSRSGLIDWRCAV